MQVEGDFERDAIEMTETHLIKAFALLDIDGSGALERDEMLAVIAELRKAHLLPGIAQARACALCVSVCIVRHGGRGALEGDEMHVVIAITSDQRRPACRQVRRWNCFQQR
jgi:hypothetical protein